MIKNLIVAVALLFATTFPTKAGEFLTYSPSLIQNALDEGKTVFVDYTAEWCPTCKRLSRVINELRMENSDYDDAIVFVSVDWDTYSNHVVATSRQIPRHSTLILLKGTEELGRVIAGNRQQVKDLLDLGLNVDS